MIVLDLRVFNDHPVRERPARGLVRSHAVHFMGRQHRLVVNRVVALGDVIDEQLPVLLREFSQHAGANGARSVTAESRVQHGRRWTDSADSCNFLDRQIGALAGQRVSLGITDQNLRQWANLHGFVVEARSFHPGIFLFAVPAGEGRLSFPDPRM